MDQQRTATLSRARRRDNRARHRRRRRKVRQLHQAATGEDLDRERGPRQRRPAGRFGHGPGQRYQLLTIRTLWQSAWFQPVRRHSAGARDFRRACAISPASPGRPVPFR